MSDKVSNEELHNFIMVCSVSILLALGAIAFTIINLIEDKCNCEQTEQLQNEEQKENN